jgi:hypothetical protein
MVVGAVAVAVYAVSFFLPALDSIVGFQAFLCSLGFVITIPMWVANPIFWFGLRRLAQGRYRSAGKAGLLALVFALSESWMCAGGLRVGYFVWVGSMAVLATVGLFGDAQEERPRRWPFHPTWTRGGEAARIAARFRR